MFTAIFVRSFNNYANPNAPKVFKRVLAKVMQGLLAVSIGALLAWGVGLVQVPSFMLLLMNTLLILNFWGSVSLVMRGNNLYRMSLHQRRSSLKNARMSFYVISMILGYSLTPLLQLASITVGCGQILQVAVQTLALLGLVFLIVSGLDTNTGDKLAQQWGPYSSVLLFAASVLAVGMAFLAYSATWMLAQSALATLVFSGLLILDVLKLFAYEGMYNEEPMVTEARELQASLGIMMDVINIMVHAVMYKILGNNHRGNAEARSVHAQEMLSVVLGLMVPAVALAYFAYRRAVQARGQRLSMQPSQDLGDEVNVALATVDKPLLQSSSNVTVARGGPVEQKGKTALRR